MVIIISSITLIITIITTNNYTGILNEYKGKRALKRNNIFCDEDNYW